MNNTKDETMKNTNLSKNSKFLMICEILYNTSYFFIDTFLIAYLFELTNQNLTVISIYYLIAYFIIGICFWLMGDLIKTKNKLTIYRCGIISNCLYVFFIIAIGEKAVDFYVLLAIVYGLSQGIYWVACHNIVNNLTNQNDCKKYVTNRNILKNITNIIVPITLGTSIHFSSYTQVGIIILFITILQIVFSFCVKEEGLDKSNQTSFNLLAFLSKIKRGKDKYQNLYHYYYIEFYSALTEGAMNTLIIAMIMMTFGSTLDLGTLTTIFSICTIVVTYLLQHFYQHKKCKKYILTCLIFMLLGTLVLVIDINKTSVIIYKFCNSIFLVILTTIANIQRYSTVNQPEIKNNIPEHQALCEIYLAAGRMVAYTALLIVSLFTNQIPFRILLFIFALCLIPYSKHILAIEKNDVN